jgi:hypothetical protein
MFHVMALRASGRLKVSVTIAPSRATITSSFETSVFVSTERPDQRYLDGTIRFIL